MKPIFSLLSFLTLAVLACNLVTAPATETPSAGNQPIETATSLPVQSEEDKAAIWQAYEEFVAYAAANLTVVTSEDIVALAQVTP